MDISRACPFCGKQVTVSVSARGYASWAAGEVIQVALPELTPDEREALKTGICPECWDTELPDEEDDE